MMVLSQWVQMLMRMGVAPLLPDYQEIRDPDDEREMIRTGKDPVGGSAGHEHERLVLVEYRAEPPLVVRAHGRGILGSSWWLRQMPIIAQVFPDVTLGHESVRV